MKFFFVFCLLAGAMGAASIPSNSFFLSGGRQIGVEVFRPEGRGPLPAVVFLHGADGLDAHGTQYRQSAMQLSRRGFAVFLVHYFDRTGTRWAGLDTITGNFLSWMSTVSDAITYAAASAWCGP